MNINLIPNELRPGRASPVPYMPLVGVVGISLVWVVTQFAAVSGARTEASDYRKEHKRLAIQLKEFKNLPGRTEHARSERDTLKLKAAAVTVLTHSGFVCTDVLQGLAKAASGNLRLTEITKPRVEAYMRDRVECVSGPSVNREVACLRKLLSHAVEAGEIESNQLLGIRMFAESPARIPTLEPADERKLIDAARPWLQLAIRIAIATGCRQGEILALRWRHVDFDNGVVVVADSKSNDARRVPLHPTLRDDLRRVRGLPEGYVVSLPNGRSPSRHSVHNAFKKAVAAIGRPDFRFHDLRHICGSRLLATGASLPEVAAVLGHKTLHMAARYAHVSWTRLSALVASMPVDAGSAPN